MLVGLYVFMRETIVNLFLKRIILLEKNNNLIKNKYLLFFINIFYNLHCDCLIKSYGYNVVYTKDKLIFYDELVRHKLMIVPAVLDFKIDNKDFLETFEKYDMHTPLYILVDIENISLDSKLEIKIFHMGKGNNEIKEFLVKDHLQKRLYQLLK
jgi:hypothetical protein